MTSLYDILERYRSSFLDKPNVIGIGIGFKEVKGKKTDKKCIVVYVEKKVPVTSLSVDSLVPIKVGHTLTDVKEIRKIKATRKQWIRPSLGGISIGHGKITAGTFGMLVDINNNLLILSNNHVLANSNNCHKGDIIYQPGPYDSSVCKQNEIGTLEKWIPIQFDYPCKVVSIIEKILNIIARLVKSRYAFKADKRTVYNLVDTAICKPYNRTDVTNTIVDIGVPKGFAIARIGDKVMKSGRTTGLTKGEIIDINASIKVQYGNETAFFENQIITTCKSAGGDSGSVLVKDTNNKPVTGLLFAGSSSYSICNHIANVRNALGI